MCITATEALSGKSKKTAILKIVKNRKEMIKKASKSIKHYKKIEIKLLRNRINFNQPKKIFLKKKFKHLLLSFDRN